MEGVRGGDKRGTGARLLVLETVALDDLRERPARGFEAALSRLSRAGARIDRAAIPAVAEALGLAASRAIGAAPADLAASGAAMAAWFSGYAGIPPGDPGFRFANHSGLSAESRVSPR
ncbi:MAG: hypothetical protein ACK4MD_10165, partial [Demequina sp.]